MLPVLLPALVQGLPPSSQPAIEREVTVAGFNGLQLKASVLPADGKGYFAVLVAGAGAVDRNWYSPSLKDPIKGTPIQSHAGRDFARWLQGQGVGSFRFDKRFIGSSDKSLDVSLDAQLGDLHSVIEAARRLPEAKGKKLLLIGHDEGALLSLMAAGGADALLLLAMPAKTQAEVIRDQIKALVPPAQAGADLAYLDSVFEAIRKRQPTPPAGEGVHPFMAAMGKSLMAPETLDFVRALLDIDPWGLASHLALPTAMAWGDRDIQTPPPAVPPAKFRGTVLELPGANHLLKQETKVRSGLRPIDAIRAYGDDTPLADLSPIEKWLKELK